MEETPSRTTHLDLHTHNYRLYFLQAKFSRELSTWEKLTEDKPIFSVGILIVQKVQLVSTYLDIQIYLSP